VIRFLDLTLGTLHENLALDEALLQGAEAGGPEVLRLWQWPDHAVVLGAGGPIADDVHEGRCRADGVPIARRASGGGTVLLGPGCLLYAVVLGFDRDPALGQIPSSYRYVLGRIVAGLAAVAPDLDLRGCSDLARLERKISGNAQQRKRSHLLQHGTLLFNFDVGAVARYLKPPPRQPEYRRQRGHEEFLADLPTGVATLKRCLREAWGAHEELTAWPVARVRELVAEKYARDEWVRRR
jgi:lipoate-protein ligase A